MASLKDPASSNPAVNLKKLSCGVVLCPVCLPRSTMKEISRSAAAVYSADRHGPLGSHSTCSSSPKTP